MKELKSTARVVKTCDVCNKGRCCIECLACGKDICNSCVPTSAVRYDGPSGLYDKSAYYCLDCDKKLVADPVHAAYAALKEVKTTTDEVVVEMRRRIMAAESSLHAVLSSERKRQG